MESFQIYNEAKAVGIPVLQYSLVSLNGRFDFLPYEEIILETITEEPRVGTEKQRIVVLNYGELSTQICGMDFNLEI